MCDIFIWSIIQWSKGIKYWYMLQHGWTLKHYSKWKKSVHSPDWCGSVGWALSRKVKDHPFNSLSGTCLGCCFAPGRGEYKRQPIDVSCSHWCLSPSFSPSLPLYLKINTVSKIKKKEARPHILWFHLYEISRIGRSLE